MKRKSIFSIILILAFAGLVFSACVPISPETAANMQSSTVDMAAEEAALIEAINKYEEAYAAGDIETLMTVYVGDEATWYPPGGAKVQGLADIEANWRDFLGNYTVERDAELVNVDIDGNKATRLMEWTNTLNPKDGSDPIVETGRCMLGYEKVDDEWKVAWEIWNTYE
jgi:ketosteroid isomerase-like protein